jgi:hypothetical protein
MSVIETERLTRSYGPHRGTVDVDLAVEQGETYGRQAIEVASRGR